MSWNWSEKKEKKLCMFICFILPARKLIMEWINEVKTDDRLWQDEKRVCDPSAPLNSLYAG